MQFAGLLRLFDEYRVDESALLLFRHLQGSAQSHTNCCAIPGQSSQLDHARVQELLYCSQDLQITCTGILT